MQLKLAEYIKDLKKELKFYWREANKAMQKDESLRMKLMANNANLLDRIIQELVKINGGK